MRKTGIKPEKPEDTDQVEKKNSVTVQYLHSYDAKSIPNRLRRWDFALLNHFLTVSAVNASTCTE